MVTYFVVQTFQAGRKGALIADPPLVAQSADGAIRTAERYSHSKAGVIAFSRAGDPATGEYEDATILAMHGTLPSEAEEMAA